jgi:hypothetical protein
MTLTEVTPSRKHPSSHGLRPDNQGAFARNEFWKGLLKENFPWQELRRMFGSRCHTF